MSLSIHELRLSQLLFRIIHTLKNDYNGGLIRYRVPYVLAVAADVVHF